MTEPRDIWVSDPRQGEGFGVVRWNLGSMGVEGGTFYAESNVRHVAEGALLIEDGERAAVERMMPVLADAMTEANFVEYKGGEMGFREFWSPWLKQLLRAAVGGDR